MNIADNLVGFLNSIVNFTNNPLFILTVALIPILGFSGKIIRLFQNLLYYRKEFIHLEKLLENGKQFNENKMYDHAIGVFGQIIDNKITKRKIGLYMMAKKGLADAHFFRASDTMNEKELNFSKILYEEIICKSFLRKHAKDYASAQLNLGGVYTEMSEIRAKLSNLKKAICLNNEVISFAIKANDLKLLWQAYNNLSVKYRYLAEAENGQINIRLARLNSILAIKELRKANLRDKVAIAKINLGTIYFTKADFIKRKPSLLRSINYFRGALRSLKIEEDPNGYAKAKLNLGNALGQLSLVESDAKMKIAHLKEGIEFLKSAYEIYKRDEYLFMYSTIINNIGNLYQYLSEYENKENNLQLAKQAFKEQLKIASPSSTPILMGIFHHNLGSAFLSIAKIENAKDNIGLAVNSFNKALEYRTKTDYPYYYAMTQFNLGNAYGQLSDEFEFNEKAKILERSIYSYKEALEFRTKEEFPFGYAEVQWNLGNALRLAAIFNKEKSILVQARHCLMESIGIWVKDEYPDQNQQLQYNLSKLDELEHNWEIALNEIIDHFENPNKQ